MRHDAPSLDWPSVAHQFRKSPAVDNYSTVPVDCVALSIIVHVRLRVLFRGTLDRIVSVIQH